MGNEYKKTYKCYGCIESELGRVCRMDVDSESYYVPDACPYENECTSLPVNWVEDKKEPEVLQNDKKAIGQKKREKMFKVRKKIEELLELVREDA